MPNKPWKEAERRLAAVLRPLFPNATRNELSGADPGATGTAADVKDTGALFVESKKLKHVPGIGIFDVARAKARKEGKRLTVVVFQPFGRPRRMALIDLDEWVRVAVEGQRVRPEPPADDTAAAYELAAALAKAGHTAVLTPRHRVGGMPVTVGPLSPESRKLSEAPATLTEVEVGSYNEMFDVVEGKAEPMPWCRECQAFRPKAAQRAGSGPGGAYYCPVCGERTVFRAQAKETPFERSVTEPVKRRP